MLDTSLAVHQQITMLAATDPDLSTLLLSNAEWELIENIGIT
jgi:hypothetical protein